MTNNKWILSLFDVSGNWAKPFINYGYRIVTVDIQDVPLEYMYDGRTHLKIDVLDDRDLLILDNFIAFAPEYPHAILAAPPCTDFSSSGARWFADKDADGRTSKSITIVHHALDIIRYAKPKYWALENPVGRIASLLPDLGKWNLKFNPCDYGGWLDPPGDAYTKNTCLWGNFNIPEKRPVEPVEGSKMWANYGGKSDRTKFMRSITPMGFATAFAAANSE